MKNKYQEALGYITYCMNVSQMHKKLTDDECNKLGEAVMQIQELVHKATPMKAKEEWVGSDDDDYIRHLCPKCNIDLYGDEYYCENCGQRLDCE